MPWSTTKTQTAHPHAIVYIRVSTSGQVKEGVSLDAQRSKIAAWYDVMSYELAQTFANEGISGHSMESRAGSLFGPSAMFAMVAGEETE